MSFDHILESKQIKMKNIVNVKSWFSLFLCLLFIYMNYNAFHLLPCRSSHVGKADNKTAVKKHNMCHCWLKISKMCISFRHHLVWCSSEAPNMIFKLGEEDIKELIALESHWYDYFMVLLKFVGYDPIQFPVSFM